MGLRFANSGWWWVVIASVQRLYLFFIHDRFFGEPRPQRFIDLCTIAKVSVLWLHGLHCLHCLR